MSKANRSTEIAFYLPSLRGGGAERTTLNLANGFADRGYEVDLVLVQAEGEYLPSVSSKVNLIDFNTKRVLHSLPKLTRYLRKKKPKAIISALHHANVICSWAVNLANTNTKTILTARDIFSSNQSNRNIHSKVFINLLKHSYLNADFVVGISKGVVNDLLSILNISDHKNFKVIYNPVINNSIDQQLNCELSHPWFYDGEPPVILAVGRLEPIKDYKTLIYAFKEVKKRRNAKLIILGEGSQRKELEDLVKSLGLSDHVMMPGFVSNPYVYMKKSALLVHSAIAEGFCNVIVEAMYCGTPIVATNGPGGPREILENGKYGSLVPVGDAKIMAKAILEALNAKFDAEILVKRAKDFEVNTILDQYQEII